MRTVSPNPVLVATDLTEASDPAIARGSAHAQAIGAPLVVCHIIPDVLRSHPLQPRAGVNELTLSSDFTKRAAELVTEQVRRVAGISPDDDTIVIESGNPEDEIVRIAEERRASMIVVGAKHGRTAHRVVRYAHVPVLVARAAPATGKILVATDFSEPSLAALVFAKGLVEQVKVDATLLHVMAPPSSFVPAFAAPFGSPIVPPPAGVIERLEELGKETLDSFAKQYAMQHNEQVEGDAPIVIVERAKALGAEMIIMGSRGRTGLARLFLGSTAEHVVKEASCSVLVAR
jgi:nucleotide-binding universal stress UspA family protein